MQRNQLARALVLSVLLIGAVSVRGIGQDTSSSLRRVGPLAPAAKEALRGVLSPDGRSFVYEVVLGEERQLWLMDVLDGKSRALTSTPGVRTEPAWSPDGRMVAYSRTQPFSRKEGRKDGLWVVAIKTGVERLVYPSREVGEYIYFESPAWTSDTTLVFWIRPDRLNFGGEKEEPAHRWTVRLNGSQVERRESPQIGQISPDGRWLLSSGSCCGGSQPGILIRAVGDSSARCLAGPLHREGSQSHTWAPDSRALYFVAGSRTDSTGHAYRIRRLKDNQWSAAERIDRLQDPAASVSASTTGSVALVVQPNDSPIGDLWIIRGASEQPRAPGPVLETCPGPPAPIMALVERARLPRVRSVDVQLELPEQGVTLFTVSYGKQVDWGLYQGLSGLLYRGRTGWIVPEQAGYTSAQADSVQRAMESFPLRSSDTLLMSERLLDTLEKRAPGFGRSFRGFLARNAATPTPVLRRLVRHDPRWNGVIQNPRLRDAATSWGELTRLAALDPEVAQVVLERPDVRDSPDRVYAIAQLPEYRGSGGMQALVRQQFRSFGPLLLRNPRTPEHMLLQLFYSIANDSRDSGGLRALYEHPGTHHSAALLTLFASDMNREPTDLAKRATEGLPRFGFANVKAARLGWMRRVRTDLTLPGAAFQHAVYQVPKDWNMLAELYQIRGRDSFAEWWVRESLARSPAPLSLLRELAESLRTDPQSGVAAGLLSNLTAREDRHILEIIAGLDTARLQNLPGWADSLLRTAPRGAHPN